MPNPDSRLKRAVIAALVLIAFTASAGLLSAQQPSVRLNRAIDKLVRGHSVVGAIMYDFSLYAARQFGSSDLDFIILDMEHQEFARERSTRLTLVARSSRTS